MKRGGILLGTLFLLACGAPNGSAITGDDELPTIATVDSLNQGAPDPSTLPEEGKFDATYPAQFDLMDSQSPVRNQRSRGVCSIFSTVALMEHLYLREGSLRDPDFSEQHLQWSVKNEVRQFTTTEGSNPSANLDAIARFGIPLETAWPYEPARWGTTNDSQCTTGENLPLRCYTNGDPPAAARAATRYRLPAGRWLSNRVNSIKAHMTTRRTAVVVTGDFFYQAWNHGGSMLPVSDESSRRGYVLYPNTQDQTDSRMRRAGHSVLLVGWDDTLQVPMVDAMGRQVLDTAGRPRMEQGFFLFKNSWGTSRFGVSNPKGAGYGWIAYRYVTDFLTAYVSDLPSPVRTTEICNNRMDDDADGRTDCADSDCAMFTGCASTGATTHPNTTAADIPDNNATGIRSTVDVAQAGALASVSVRVDITHPYRGDLLVKLLHPSGREAVLLDHQGAGDDDVHQTFTVNTFAGLDAAGRWTLVIADTASADAGRLTAWTLDLVRGAGGTSMPTVRTYENGTSRAIPDASASGTTTTISVPDSGPVRSLSVTVDITHPRRGDLTLKLTHGSVPAVLLLRADASTGANLQRTFDLTDFVGAESSGTWSLQVIDETRGQTGTLNFWRVSVGR